MSKIDSYPWLSSVHQQVWGDLAQQLSHAFLLEGTPDSGIPLLMDELAADLVCEKQDGLPQCGACDSCLLTQSDSHPDVYWVKPTGRGRQILIDTIREIIDKVTQTSVRGHRRVVVIHHAYAMNVSASNAILKILEEPPEDVVFLLGLERGQVLPTIKSRCQRVLFPEIEAGVLSDWCDKRLACESIPAKGKSRLLQLMACQPLKLEGILESGQVEAVLKFDAHLLNPNYEDIPDLLSELSSVGADTLLEWSLGVLQQVARKSPDIMTDGSLYSWLLDQYSAYCSGVALNENLMLHALLLKWAESVQVA